MSTSDTKVSIGYIEKSGLKPDPKKGILISMIVNPVTNTISFQSLIGMIRNVKVLLYGRGTHKMPWAFTEGSIPRFTFEYTAALVMPRSLTASGIVTQPSGGFSSPKTARTSSSSQSQDPADCRAGSSPLWCALCKVEISIFHLRAASPNVINIVPPLIACQDSGSRRALYFI